MGHNESLVSVIIPVYKCEKVFNRCIDSVLAQDYSSFELLLTDDGSQDASSQICDTYALDDERIIVIHQKNKGVSGARNSALKIGIGKWLVFVDSDDYVSEKYISGLIDDNYDFVANNAVIIDENKKTSFKIPYPEAESFAINTDELDSMLLSNWLNWSVSKKYNFDIIRREKLAFNENINIAEDTLFTVNYLLYAKNARCINKYNYFYVRYLSRSQLSMSFSADSAKKANVLICDLLHKNDPQRYLYVLDCRQINTYTYLLERNVLPMYPWNINKNVSYIKTLIRDDDFISLVERNGNFTFFSNSLVNAICCKKEQRIRSEYLKWMVYRLCERITKCFTR